MLLFLSEHTVFYREFSTVIYWYFSTVTYSTIGKGNLIYRGTGKQAFSFFNRETGDKLRVCLKAKNTQNIDRKTWQKYLLEAPVEEVFEFSVPKYDLPERARIFNTEVCELCGEGAPEHKMRLSGGKRVCLDCVTEYNRGW